MASRVKPAPGFQEEFVKYYLSINYLEGIDNVWPFLKSFSLAQKREGEKNLFALESEQLVTLFADQTCHFHEAPPPPPGGLAGNFWKH